MADILPPPAGKPPAAPARPRLIVMGSAALCEGFGLIGMETYPDATRAGVEAVLAELARAQVQALLFLEHGLARVAGDWLKQVRNESGRIVVTEVPPLNAPADYRPAVDEVVRSILGPAALEDTEDTQA